VKLMSLSAGHPYVADSWCLSVQLLVRHCWRCQPLHLHGGALLSSLLEPVLLLPQHGLPRLMSKHQIVADTVRAQGHVGCYATRADGAQDERDREHEMRHCHEHLAL
jgi:hypothetical protein